MVRQRAGFGEDPASRGFDITQGYRDINPYFDSAWAKRQIAPYAGSGLPQDLGSFLRMTDRQLYDMAAHAVIKLAGLGGGGNNNPPPGDGGNNPPPGDGNNNPPPGNNNPPPPNKPPKHNKPPKTHGGTTGGVGSQNPGNNNGGNQHHQPDPFDPGGPNNPPNPGPPPDRGQKPGQNKPKKPKTPKPPTGSGSCFLEDAPILMGDGSTKPISQIIPGHDLVMAFDESTGEQSAQMVLARVVHPDNTEPRLRITLDTGEIIETTEAHRFFDAEDLEWFPIKDFAEGNLLLHHDRDVAMIVSIERVGNTEPVDVFNLTVASHPNFFVNGVLAHNVKTTAY